MFPFNHRVIHLLVDSKDSVTRCWLPYGCLSPVISNSTNLGLVEILRHTKFQHPLTVTNKKQATTLIFAYIPSQNSIDPEERLMFRGHVPYSGPSGLAACRTCFSAAHGWRQSLGFSAEGCCWFCWFPFKTTWKMILIKPDILFYVESLVDLSIFHRFVALSSKALGMCFSYLELALKNECTGSRWQQFSCTSSIGAPAGNVSLNDEFNRPTCHCYTKWTYPKLSQSRNMLVLKQPWWLDLGIPHLQKPKCHWYFWRA